MEGIREPPRRVQLLFNRVVRSMGARGIMVFIHANSNTVGEFFQDICDRFGLRCTSRHGPILKLDEYTIPLFESTSIFRDLDKIMVEGDFISTRRKKSVATETIIKEPRKRPFSRVEGDFCFPEKTGLKREQKEVKIPPRPKKKQAASINNSTSTGFRGGPKGQNVHKACPGNGTQQSLPSHLIPGQPRFMSPDESATNGEAANVNESTPPQQNGRDAWEPKH